VVAQRQRGVEKRRLKQTMKRQKMRQKRTGEKDRPCGVVITALVHLGLFFRKKERAQKIVGGSRGKWTEAGLMANQKVKIRREKAKVPGDTILRSLARGCAIPIILPFPFATMKDATRKAGLQNLLKLLKRVKKRKVVKVHSLERRTGSEAERAGGSRPRAKKSVEAILRAVGMPVTKKKA